MLACMQCAFVRMLTAMDSDAKKLAARGGKARAQSLSKEQRSEIATQAAAARWAKDGIPRATHSGELTIGDMVIPCAVLDNGTRILTQRELMTALGRSNPMGVRDGGNEHVPAILRGKALKSFISEDLLETSRPIRFIPAHGGLALGYRAESLPRICDVYLRAREAKKLPYNQQHIAKQAEIIVRALSQVAIIALVDEATGYQYQRDKDALAKILEAFVTKELRKWVSTFPADFYRELFRLRGWKFPTLPQEQQKRPILVGKLTNDVVYARLAPGVRQELHRLTPRDEKGRLKHKLFQSLTEETGSPRLKEHLASVIALMRASDDWEHFMRSLNRALPKYRDLPLFDQLEETDMTPAN
jgi:hypothetical protein